MRASGGAIAVVALVAAAPAAAQTVTLKPLADARLRYEHVAQDGFAADADAVTIRVRTGVEAKANALSALVETQGTLAIRDAYYDGLHGVANRPIVSDPQTIALYRAQLRYAAPGLAVTVGRQKITLDDERFVGNAAFRQNAQTFDALRVEWSPVKRVKADLSYVRGIRTIWGVDGRGSRPAGIGGDTLLGNLGVATPVGTVTAFAYLIDQDSAAVQAFRLSTQTYGARLAGSRPLGDKAKLSYQASYARQSEYARNPNRFAASYYLADTTLDIAKARLGAGYEVLGADTGAALTSFQAPLGAVFKFQGWADKFLTTPPNGVRDLYASAGYTIGAIGRVKAVSLQAVAHRFTSDRVSRHYGDEIDLLATAKLGRYALSARYADYRADAFAVDTRKAWLQLDWTL